MWRRSSLGSRSSARSATTTPSSAGRWRTTTPSPRSSRRWGARPPATRARPSSSTAPRARSPTSRTARRWRRSSSAADTPELQRQGPPRGARRMAHLEGEPVVREEHRQPRLAAVLRPRHHQSAGRCPREQPAEQPAAPGRAGARSSIEYNYDLRKLVRDITTFPTPTSSPRSRVIRASPTRATSPSRRSAAWARRPCSTRSPASRSRR
jgi:hypothetical protein